jgi:hypothetical protein
MLLVRFVRGFLRAYLVAQGDVLQTSIRRELRSWLIVFSQRDEVYTGGVKRGHEVAFDCDLGGCVSN